MTTASSSFRAGLVQLCCGRDVTRNIADADELIRQAAAAGAHYIQTPENTALMELERERLFALTPPEERSQALATFVDTARELKIWLHIGSLAVALPEGRLANRAYVIAPNGDITARYDKIHMFDVDLGNGESYRESANFQPGSEAVVAALPWGLLGLTICYDVRFPALHRALAHAGASFIAGPAAFTKITGQAHWHALLRARAIETETFILAAAQSGRHENGRETFGHSLIVAPWGEIIADAPDGPGIVTAEIDTTLIAAARARVPSLQHDRPFAVRGPAEETPVTETCS